MALTKVTTGVLADNSVTADLIADDAVTAAKIEDAAVTSAKLAATLSVQDLTVTGTGALKVASGTTAERPTAAAGQLRYNSTLAAFEGYTNAWAALGGIGSEYITATPTLSSSVSNQLVITNYSSYASPTFVTKIGSTIISHTNSAGTLTFSVDMSIFSGTQTVSVQAIDVGKLNGASATVSVVFPSSTARYWRLTNQVLPSNVTVFIYTAWQLYSSLNGGGTKRGSASAITTSMPSQTGYNVQALYAGTSAIAWYNGNPPSPISSIWVQYDLGSPQEVLSMKYKNYTSTTNYYASSFTIQNSNDGTNWADVKDVTQTSGQNTLTAVNL
tara:strand:+ start:233 stop:1219 length:987 start_codon:yes stop_codon:yes gene_type:complete